MRVHTLIRNLVLTVVAALSSSAVWAQGTVNPLKTVMLSALPSALNATDNPVNIPLAAGTDMTQFHAGNVIKIDSEYFLVTAVTPSAQPYSTITASRAQLGSSAAPHNVQAPISRVYQLDVLLTSPNPIGAYQLNVNYDSSRLSIVQVNVFPGDPGPFQNPIAMNTNNPGTVILNSFNAGMSFTGGPTSVARLYFTGTGGGTANVSVNLTSLADGTGTDLDPASNTVTTALNTASLTVTTLNLTRRRFGQITSQN
jgi:hypothetical protein